MKTLVKRALFIFEKWFATDMTYLAKGGGWLALGQVIGAVISFCGVVILSRFLSQETFGAYRYILSFVGIISVFSLPGVSTALTQAVAQGYEGSYLDILKTKLKWGVTSSLVSLGIAAYYFFQGNEVFCLAFLSMGLLVPFLNAFNLYRSVYVGRKIFQGVSVSDTVSALVSLVVMTITVLWTKSVPILIAVYFAHTAIIRFVLWIHVKRNFALNEVKNPETLTFGKHLSLMSVIGTMAGQLDKILIFHYLGAAQLSVYFIAMAPVERLKGILGNIETLAFLKIAKQDLASLKINLPRKIRIFGAVVIVGVCIYILLSPLLFKVFFPQYLESIAYSQVAVLSLIFFPRSLITAVFSAHMKTKELYITRTVGPIIRIIVLFAFVHLWGVWGVIGSLIVTEIILYSLYQFLFIRMK